MLFLALECLPLLPSGGLAAGPSGASGGPAVAAVEDDYREAVTVLGRDGVLRRIGKVVSGAEIVLDGVFPPLRQARFSADGRLLALIDAKGTLHLWSYRVRTAWRGEERVLEPVARPVFDTALPPGTALAAVAGDSGSAAVLLGAPIGGLLLRSADGGMTTLVLEAAAPAMAGALAADVSQAWLAGAREVSLYDLSGTSPGRVVAPAATALLDAEPTAAAMVLGAGPAARGDRRPATGPRPTRWRRRGP